MRPLSVITLVLVCTGCVVGVPRPVGLGVAVKSRVKVSVRADADVHVPPAPAPAVAIVDAPVVEFFGIPLEGVQDVVFVLDCSGSMDTAAQGQLGQVAAPAAQPTDPEAPPAATRKIDVARAELVDALQRLPAGTRMNIIFFNSDVSGLAATMVPLEEENREGLIAFVNGKAATGSTALAPAMRTALLMNATRVVLLSDGRGNVGGDSRVLLRDAREAMRGGVRIDTIGLGNDQDRDLLQTLADESGGLYQAF